MPVSGVMYLMRCEPLGLACADLSEAIVNMEQHEITERGLLLDPDGTLREPGWAKSLILDYNRHSIRESKYRIKEWDYYMVNDDEYAVAFTLFDAGYSGMVSISVIDLLGKDETTTTVLVPLPSGKIKLPTTSKSGISFFENKRVKVIFEAEEDRRILDVMMHKFRGLETFVAHIELDNIPQDSMVIATPWREQPTAFYYNQKIVAMRARGDFCVGTKVHHFDGLNSFGLLDWGRGVWTYDNRWFWGVAQGRQNGHVVGFNLGYGFGDTSAASENMFFLDGVCHKLDRVDFGIPMNPDGSFDLMDDWHMRSNDGRFTMEFHPSIDRSAYMNFGVIMSDQHQILGKFDGTVVLDDGTPFEIKDLFASAEVVHNKY
ncbi:MAG: DUF2804 domain-containing protein [Coriobacteriales bacterium]